MSNLLELTAQIVSSHAKKKSMTTEELIQDLQLIHTALQIMESGAPTEPATSEEPTPTLTLRQAFKKNEVLCMICLKGFTTLTRHLGTAHDLKPGQYRKQFGIKSTQKLAAKSYSEARRQQALDRGMTDILANARETRMANIEKKKAEVPAVRVKPPAPAKRIKPAVPVVSEKTAPAKASKK